MGWINLLKLMRKHRIKSYCKINISLRVIKKMKNGLHKINSFVAFAKIYDQLYIQENKNKKDIIKFMASLEEALVELITQLLKL